MYNLLFIQILMEKIEKMEKERGLIIGSMIHDIRSPIMGIIGILEILIESNKNKEQQEFLKLAFSSAENLLSLSNKAMELSYLFSGTLKLDSQSFSICELIEEICEEYAVIVQKKNLEINWLIESEVPQHVFGDPIKLKQVITNLTYNAIKSTDKGEITIQVKVEDESSDKITLRFEVSDTGVGIPKKCHDTLFTPFSQTKSFKKKNQNAPGLELSISREIVKLMNGTIGFESKESSGTKFWFTADFIKSSEDSILDSNTKLLANSELNPDLCMQRDYSAVKALIVDDSSVFRLSLGRKLKSWGVEVYEASNTVNALEFLIHSGSESFNVVFIDSEMPNMSASELAEKIKSSNKLKDIQLVCLKPFSDISTSHPKYRNFSRFINKPIRTSKLKICLDEVTDFLNRKIIINDDSCGFSEAIKTYAEISNLLLSASE
ncbi:MAG: response regulator [Candidatus Riflebacteria bacterium]|nr:response regulator [Candidatus Riflebacteria bacterium]